jgi:hypothetical protein
MPSIVGQGTQFYRKPHPKSQQVSTRQLASSAFRAKNIFQTVAKAQDKRRNAPRQALGY